MTLAPTGEIDKQLKAHAPKLPRDKLRGVLDAILGMLGGEGKPGCKDGGQGRASNGAGASAAKQLEKGVGTCKTSVSFEFPLVTGVREYKDLLWEF